MPFPRPSRSELLDGARAEIETRLPGSDARLRRSMLDTLARIIAAATHGLHGFQSFIARQAFPDTAESEFLRQWSGLYGVQEIPAQFAAGSVTFTGSELADIGLGTTLRRADGREYQTSEAGAISAGSVTLGVISTTPGLDGNADAGVTLTLLSPLPGIASNATVAVGGLAGGTDVEGEESLRARLVAQIRRPPGGGTKADYIGRAKLYAGVTDVFVHPQQYGAGTVGVAPLFYDRADPIPVAGDLTAIQALLDDVAFRIIGATSTVYALTPQAVNFTLHIVPDTADVRAAIQADLADLFRREATPGGKLLLSRIREVISQAAGESDHTLTAPAANPDLAGDLTKIHKLGTFTWT